LVSLFVVKFTAAFFAFVCILGGNANAAESVRPNILFVIADQWRAQAFGFAGDPNVKTPHLDRFERQCVNFTQAAADARYFSQRRAVEHERSDAAEGAQGGGL
jgi:hypothetical protein